MQQRDIIKRVSGGPQRPNAIDIQDWGTITRLYSEQMVFQDDVGEVEDIELTIDILDSPITRSESFESISAKKNNKSAGLDDILST